MLESARRRFADDPTVTVIEHNMEQPLPALEAVDMVVSSFAIHHLEHPRKRALYAEIFERLAPGGVFCNLEHVASPSQRLHDRFLERINRTRETEDRSNKLLDMDTQLGWLREIGFRDVDCYWKWLEFALIGGVK
jgi:SAM-dependent methyltransferase